MKSVPVLAKLRAWLDETRPRVLPSSPLGKALACFQRHWTGLIAHCEDCRFAIDTHRVENAIRPLCIGRRNGLFADTVAGAQTGANLYSLIENAKLNDLDPYVYLRHVFTWLPQTESPEAIERLLPDNVDPALLTG